MKAKKKGMPYAKYRPLIHQSRENAEKRAVQIIPCGPERAWSDWCQRRGVLLMAVAVDDPLTQSQLELMRAEYEAAYCNARLHHVRQRNRMGS